MLVKGAPGVTDVVGGEDMVYVVVVGLDKAAI